MPTATSTLSWVITNWGPLTTPWALPSACSNQVWIYPTDEPLLGHPAECDNGLFPCLPEPTDSDAPSALSAARLTPTLGFHAPPIYSPAPACPEGWKTVGAAGRDGDGPVSRSGWFTVPYESTLEEQPEGAELADAGFQDVLASLLDPSETAVMCCPSSMTVNNLGGCRSTLDDYSISTACHTHFRPDGIDDILTSIGAGQVSWTTDLSTFAASELPSLTAEAAVDALMLLHKPTDVSGDGGDEGAEEDTEEEDPSETNAALALRAGDGVWGIPGRVLLSAVGSMVAGAAMVLLR
ncbi:hypothetical protein BJY00DRAFT_315098 [Aspergillus carlsbadensis]|nr:hypothetical protein BJY00DRAFT_315098 [Aspergillus carlsbadensis]